MRIITEIPDDDARIKRYDWNLVFDGHTRELEQGIDFTCQPSSLTSTVRGAARRRGIDVDVRSYTRSEDQQVVVAVRANRAE